MADQALHRSRRRVSVRGAVRGVVRCRALQRHAIRHRWRILEPRGETAPSTPCSRSSTSRPSRCCGSPHRARRRHGQARPGAQAAGLLAASLGYLAHVPRRSCQLEQPWRSMMPSTAGAATRSRRRTIGRRPSGGMSEHAMHATPSTAAGTAGTTPVPSFAEALQACGQGSACSRSAGRPGRSRSCIACWSRSASGSTKARYLNALNFCMLLPGPEAMQLATYVGWRLHGAEGRPGGGPAVRAARRAGGARLCRCCMRRSASCRWPRRCSSASRRPCSPSSSRRC